MYRWRSTDGDAAKTGIACHQMFVCHEHNTLVIAPGPASIGMPRGVTESSLSTAPFCSVSGAGTVAAHLQESRTEQTAAILGAGG